MNQSIDFFRYKAFHFATTILFLMLANLTIAANQAQNAPEGISANTGSGQNPAPVVVDRSVDGQTFASAKAAAQQGNLSLAEQGLTHLNVSAPNTADWHRETTQRLTQMASELAHEGHAEVVSQVIDKALQHLAQAKNFTQNDRSRADGLVMEAFIHERFRGDFQSAILSYLAAVKLQPTDLEMKTQLLRLQMTWDNFQARIHPVKK